MKTLGDFDIIIFITLKLTKICDNPAFSMSIYSCDIGYDLFRWSDLDKPQKSKLI